MTKALVYLNVYDMYWLNNYASNLGIGIFHSGIEVYGIEYGYGGHTFQFSGIFENSPKDAEKLGDNFKFRENIFIGETDFSFYEVKKIISYLGQEYRGDRYHLITKNCNHFSSAFSKILTGFDIPLWVNRLASISSSIPFIEKWLPQEWLTPIALQQTSNQNNTEFSSLESSNKISDNYDEKGNYTSTSSLSSNENQNISKFLRRSSSSTISTAQNLPFTKVSKAGSDSERENSINCNQSFTRLWISIKNMASGTLENF